MSAVSMHVSYNEDGSVEITVIDPGSGRQAVFLGAHGSSKRIKRLSDIPNSKWSRIKVLDQGKDSREP